MKYVLLLVLLFADSWAVYGQHTEVSLQLQSGLFRFAGSGSGQLTSFDGSSTLETPGRAFLPYGQRAAFSFGITGQAERITSGLLIYGLQAGYESLASVINLSGGFIGFMPAFNVEGKSVLRNQFANVHPFVGKRFGRSAINVDITAGVDFGIGLRSAQTGAATAMGREFAISEVRTVPTVDYRPRVTVTGYHKSYGLSAAYSHGLVNYAKGLPLSGQFNAYPRFWRIGIVYRLRKSV